MAQEGMVVEELAQTRFRKQICTLNCINQRAYGPMDKAPAYGAGDSGFDPR